MGYNDFELIELLEPKIITDKDLTSLSGIKITKNGLWICEKSFLKMVKIVFKPQEFD